MGTFFGGDVVLDSFNKASRQEAAKKNSGQSIKAFSPPPLRLSGQKNGYIKRKEKNNIKKVLFYLVDNPLPPLPFSGLSTKKKLFLRH